MLEQLEQDLQQAVGEADRFIAAAGSVEELHHAESRLLGKQGAMGRLLALIGKLPKEERGPAGQRINDTKRQIVERFATARARLEQSTDIRAAAETRAFDPTLPAPVVPRGSLHPVTAVQWEVEDIMARLGFVVVGVVPDANGFGKPDILMAKRVGG